MFNKLVILLISLCVKQIVIKYIYTIVFELSNLNRYLKIKKSSLVLYIQILVQEINIFLSYKKIGILYRVECLYFYNNVRNKVI